MAPVSGRRTLTNSPLRTSTDMLTQQPAARELRCGAQQTRWWASGMDGTRLLPASTLTTHKLRW